MKYMGIFTGAVVLAFVLGVSNVNNTIFADSCCSVKKDAHECSKECANGCVKKVSTGESTEGSCPVCGQAADSKGKQVDVEHGGETVHLCCEGCAAAYNENPDKYDETKKPRESYRDKNLQPEKKKKQRGEGYY